MIQRCLVKLQRTLYMELHYFVKAQSGNLQTNIHHRLCLDWLTRMAQTLLVTLHSILKMVISTSKAKLNSSNTDCQLDSIKSIRELSRTGQGAHCNLEVEDIIIKAGIHNSNIHFHRSPFGLDCCSSPNLSCSLTLSRETQSFLILNIFSFY